MPVIHLSEVPVVTGSSYPEPWASEMRQRSSRRVAAFGGLTQFGINLITIQPGGKSSLRHWHAHEDEFVYVTQGELVLVQDRSEILMGPGAMAAFKAGDPDGHHFINRSFAPATFLVVGTDAATETCTYSDVDLVNHSADGRSWFTRRDGTFVKES